ncbi:MAG TPA: glycosyltransferase family 2 protein, partial [Steroidobacteraceae bacterium]|nr:glycosyltransferase family 2 protein [Steroidobacteraceae bacterium]
MPVQRTATQASTPPEVTIGMPVYNGDVHLVAAIESLLAQSFTDFELLISDNASTDGTARICEDYAARDSRVRYIRQSRNVGATANWNLVARAATGRYFKWAAANDVVPPLMLEHAVETLRSHPDIALCYGLTKLIDDRGNVLGVHEADPEILDAQPSVRFERLLNELVWNNAQAGLIRTSALRRTRFDRDYIDGDMVLMAELVLSGGFRKLHEIFLHRRMDKGSATRFLSDSERQDFLVPGSSGRPAPVLTRHLDRFFSVWRASIPWSEKWRALRYVLRTTYW